MANPLEKINAILHNSLKIHLENNNYIDGTLVELISFQILLFTGNKLY